MDHIKRQRQPLGGAPPVKVPPLNAGPVDGGGSMHQQAEVLQDPRNPLSPTYNPQLAMMAASGQPGSPPQPGGPFAPLPPEAAQQPGFVPGVGSMVAGNQPALRNQAPQEAPQDPSQPYKPQISDKTRESMAALESFQKTAQTTQQQAASETPKPASTVAIPDGMEDPNKEGQLYEELREIIDNDQQWSKLNNPDRKKRIGKRLKPLDIAEIILYGEVRQDVPVLTREDNNKELIFTYRSVSAGEDLEIKRMMFGEEGGDRYLMDKYTIMQLTLALVAINGEELPGHLDDKNKFDESKFLNKFEKVVAFPVQFIADLGVQYLWFDERVRDLFVGSTDALKNS
jgi:hypothetical protein